MEGDILVEINNINVRNMCHGEVVQVLKDCTRNEEATITVQRGGLRPLKKDDTKYRSKTPTTELYGSRPKEVIIAGRPKTPLVDTRTRVKTPVHDSNHLDDPTAVMDERWKYQSVDDRSIGGGSIDHHLGYYSVKKKETTSFEHEQPRSNIDTRYDFTFFISLVVGFGPRSIKNTNFVWVLFSCFCNQYVAVSSALKSTSCNDPSAR